MNYKDRRYNPKVGEIAKQKIAQFLINRRKELDLTQSDLATMAGIRRGTVGDVEAGDRGYNFDTLLAICTCLRLHIEFETRDIDSIPGFDKPHEN